jgi:hypothetical protein
MIWLSAANGTGPIERNTTNGATQPGDGKPIALDGRSCTRGLRVAAPISVLFGLSKVCRATAGVPDGITLGASVTRVFGDDELLYESPFLTQDSSEVDIDVDVTGKYQLELFVSNAGTPGGILRTQTQEELEASIHFPFPLNRQGCCEAYAFGSVVDSACSGNSYRLSSRRHAAATSSHVFARSRAYLLAEDTMELRIASESSLKRRFVEIAAPSFDKAQETLNPKSIPVLNKRYAHLGLEEPREVTCADIEVARERVPTNEGVLIESALHLSNHAVALRFT